jgi:hypothetical protein
MYHLNLSTIIATYRPPYIVQHIRQPLDLKTFRSQINTVCARNYMLSYAP